MKQYIPFQFAWILDNVELDPSGDPIAFDVVGVQGYDNPPSTSGEYVPAGITGRYDRIGKNGDHYVYSNGNYIIEATSSNVITKKRISGKNYYNAEIISSWTEDALPNTILVSGLGEFESNSNSTKYNCDGIYLYDENDNAWYKGEKNTYGSYKLDLNFIFDYKAPFQPNGGYGTQLVSLIGDEPIKFNEINIVNIRDKHNLNYEPLEYEVMISGDITTIDHQEIFETFENFKLAADTEPNAVSSYPFNRTTSIFMSDENISGHVATLIFDSDSWMLSSTAGDTFRQENIPTSSSMLNSFNPDSPSRYNKIGHQYVYTVKGASDPNINGDYWLINESTNPLEAVYSNGKYKITHESHNMWYIIPLSTESSNLSYEKTNDGGYDNILGNYWNTSNLEDLLTVSEYSGMTNDVYANLSAIPSEFSGWVLHDAIQWNFANGMEGTIVSAVYPENGIEIAYPSAFIVSNCPNTVYNGTYRRLPYGDNLFYSYSNDNGKYIVATMNAKNFEVFNISGTTDCDGDYHYSDVEHCWLKDSDKKLYILGDNLCIKFNDSVINSFSGISGDIHNALGNKEWSNGNIVLSVVDGTLDSDMPHISGGMTMLNEICYMFSDYDLVSHSHQNITLSIQGTGFDDISGINGTTYYYSSERNRYENGTSYIHYQDNAWYVNYNGSDVLKNETYSNNITALFGKNSTWVKLS